MPNGGPTAIAPTTGHRKTFRAANSPIGPPPDATTTKYKKSFTESKKWNTYQEEQTEDGVWKGQLISLTWEKGKWHGKWHDGYVKEEWGWTPPSTTNTDDDVPKAKAKAKAKTKVTPKAKAKAKGKAKLKAKAKGKAKAKARGRGGN